MNVWDQGDQVRARLLIVSLCDRRIGELSRATCLMPLILCMGALPRWPNHLPKMPSPNTITRLGVWILTYEFWGTQHLACSRVHRERTCKAGEHDKDSPFQMPYFLLFREGTWSWPGLLWGWWVWCSSEIPPLQTRFEVQLPHFTGAGEGRRREVIISCCSGSVVMPCFCCFSD